MRPEAEEEFRAFVEARSRALRRVGYLLTGDLHDAEDLVQLAFSKTYAVWPKLQPAARFESYVRTTMYRAAISIRHRRERERSAVQTLRGTPPDVIPPEFGHDMWMRLQQLPARQRAVLVLRYYEDLSIAESAEILRCSEGTVKSQTHRGLEKLRRATLEASARESLFGDRP